MISLGKKLIYGLNFGRFISNKIYHSKPIKKFKKRVAKS